MGKIKLKILWWLKRKIIIFTTQYPRELGRNRLEKKKKKWKKRSIFAINVQYKSGPRARFNLIRLRPPFGFKILFSKILSLLRYTRRAGVVNKISNENS